MNYPWRKKKNHSELDDDDAPRNPARKNAFRRPFCPVTCNLPTRMPKEIFTRLCNTNRNSDDQNYCNQVCRGKRLPDGLEFIETITFINEDHAMPQYKPGTCLLCEKSKNVLSILGKKTCSTCGPVITAVRNTPDLLVKALIIEQNQQWADEHFIKEMDDGSLQEEVAGLQVEIADLRKLLADRQTIIDEQQTILDDRQAIIDDLLNQPQPENLPLERACSCHAETEPTKNRDSLLLEIAFAIIDGNPSSIDPQTLRALR